MTTEMRRKGDLLVNKSFTNLFTYDRVYLHYHSLAQVLVGGSLGFMLGVTWMLFAQSFAVRSCSLPNGVA